MQKTAYLVLLCQALAWMAVATYALYNAWLACQAWRARGRAPTRPAAPEVWPVVTVQLPLYNESNTAPLLQAVAALDYPRDRLQIQVLDDSTDPLPMATHVRTWQARGIPMEHVHRPQRTGYKAGALAAGMQRAHGSLFLLLDADFIPPANLLRRLVPWFNHARVGMVQARWGSLGAERNVLTRCAAYWIARHFHIDQLARSRFGEFFHFNGSAGMWRRSCIHDAGGWLGDTLAEDMDLSFRAWLRGWQFVYDHDVVVPAQIPPDAAALRIQQERWSCGTFQVARRALPHFATAKRWRDAGVSFLHLTGYCFAMLLLVLALTTGLTCWAAPHAMGLAWAQIPAGIFSVYIAVRTAVCWITGGVPRARLELEAAAAGIGLTPVLMVGAWAAWRGQAKPFHRTPKQAQIRRDATWQPLAGVELMLAALCAANAGVAVVQHAWGMVLLPALAAWGLGSMAFSTLLPRALHPARVPQLNAQ